MWKPLIPALLMIHIGFIGGIFARSDSGAAVAGSDTLVAVIPADFPPTYFYDKQNGQAAGFAVDVFNSIASHAGFHVRYIYGKAWDEIIAMASDGRADVIPSLTVDSRRAGTVSYSSPVEINPIGCIVRQTSDIESLREGLHVGVMRNSAALHLIEKQSGIIVSQYEELDRMLLDLLAGRIDMLVAPVPNIEKVARNYGLHDKLRMLHPYLHENTRAIAVRKGNDSLLARIDSSAKRFVGSNEYRQIYTKWYGRPDPWWTLPWVPFATGGVFGVLLVGMALWRYFSLVRINRRLIESEQAFRTLFESSADLVFIVDKKGLVREVNGETLRRLSCSRDDLVGHPITTFDVPESAALAPERMASIFAGKRGSFQTRVYTRNKDELVLDVNAVLVDFKQEPMILSVCRDVTSRLLIEAQLRQAQKMEAIGQLAGGVAHDFNNLLGGITGYADILEEKLSGHPAIVPYVNNIFEICNRATSLTRKLLDFSRKGRLRTVDVDMHGVIADVVGIAEQSIDRRIVLLSDLRADQAHISGDPDQIANALLNLVINARDAMPEGGSITLSTANIILPEGNAELLTPGDYISVAVSDTGEGIPEQIRERIFEPFFTTKNPGKGTGLGLAAVYGCVQEHSGGISVTSMPGAGSRFTILLPVVKFDETIETAPAINNKEVAIRALHVLLVDDEKMIRDSGAEMLQGMGFSIETACDGREALEKFREHYNRIDLVMIDAIMPNMNGRDAIAAMREIDPMLRVVMMSGYTSNLVGTDLEDLDLDGFLQKPFRKSELISVLKSIPEKHRGA